MLNRNAKSFRTIVRRFAGDERGNVAAMFFVILPVLLTAIGAAIDYSRAASARSAPCRQRPMPPH